MLTTKKVEYGLAIGVRREDNTKIELLDRVDNGYFAMVRDGVLIMNIYLPQQGRGEDKLTQALAKIKPVLQEHSGMETFLAGDFNVSLNQKKGPERVSLLEEMTNNAGLKKLSPLVTTNYNFCGSQTIIDYSYFSENIKVDTTYPYVSGHSITSRVPLARPLTAAPPSLVTLPGDDGRAKDRGCVPGRKK